MDTLVALDRNPEPCVIRSSYSRHHVDCFNNHMLDLRKKLNKAEEKYIKYVIIASTTPSYFWTIVGTIPAIAIAGFYGKLAARKQREIKGK